MADPDRPTDEPVNLFSADFAACPHATYQSMLESDRPVKRMALVGTPVLSRYEDVMWALRHPEIFSSEMEAQMSLGTERPMIPQQIDPPAQTRYRKLLDPQFSRKRMLAIEPGLRADAHALVDAVIDQGGCEFDAAFAIPFPCNAFLHLMGLPHEELDLFLELKDGIIRPATTDPEEAPRLRAETGRRIYDYFEKLIATRRADPRDDLMSHLVSAEIDGERLTDNDILDISFLLLLAGLDTVTATLGCSIAYLAANPDQRRAIVQDPALMPGAVEELLRWETPVTAVPRVAKRDVEVHGTQIREGELVTMLLGAANIDAGQFDDAATVDFARPSNKHIAFGAGAHRCLGSHLARLELQVALEVWHERIPDYAITEGEVPRYTPGIREVQYLPLTW